MPISLLILSCFLTSISIFFIGALYGAYLGDAGHRKELEKRLKEQKEFYQKALTESMKFSSRLVRELNELEKQAPKRGEHGRYVRRG